MADQHGPESVQPRPAEHGPESEHEAEGHTFTHTTNCAVFWSLGGICDCHLELVDRQKETKP